MPLLLEIWDDCARYRLNMEILVEGDAPSGMLAEEDRHFGCIVRGKAMVPKGARYEDAIKIERWIARF